MVFAISLLLEINDVKVLNFKFIKSVTLPRAANELFIGKFSWPDSSGIIAYEESS